MADAKTDFTTNIPNRIKNNADRAKAVGAVFLFEIDGPDGGTWTVNCKDNLGVTEGNSGNADCVIKMTDANWKSMSENPGAAMQMYFSGALKVSGPNPMLATKLREILS